MKKIHSILLVDDDATTNYVNTYGINKAQITEELLIASNGREAIELIEKRCKEPEAKAAPRVPELILLDINMPIMDGFGFLECVKEIECYSNQSVIAVLTTSLNPRDIERVKESGVQEFLSKPLTIERLQQLVVKYFN